MAYNKIMVVVTPEQAEEIIRYGFAYDDAIYREAIEKLQADKPDSDVLATLIEDIEDNIDIRASKYEMAKTYQARAQTIPATADDDLTAAAEQYKQEYEAWSNMHEGSEELANASDASDAESIDPNDSFDNLLASLQGFEQGDDPQWRHVVRSVNEQIDIRKGKNYENEDWNTLVQTLWETVKTKILVDRTLNKEWQAVMKKGGQEKDEWLREEIKRVYTAEAVIQAGATKVDKPTKAEKELGSQAHADRIARIAKQAQETFDDYVRKNKKLVISSDQVVIGAANAWSKLKSFIKYSEIKQLGQSFVAKLENYRDSFDSRMQQRHPKAWKFAKEAAESFKASKWQTITDVAVTTVTMGIGTATGAFAAAMVGYAAYMTISGFVWPIANKKALELNRAKKKGAEAATEWKGKTGWIRAANAIFGNPRERKSYWWRVAGRTVASGLAAGVTVLSGPVETVAGLATLRFKQGFMRVLGTVSGQAGLVVGDTIAYAKDKTAENKGYLKQSATGLAVSTVFSGVALWLAHHFVTEPVVEHQAQQNLAESLVVGNAASKDLPEGATLLAETKSGGRAYQLGDRVIFEENGTVARNIDKSTFENYKGDASNEDYAAKVLAHDESKQAEAAQKAAAAFAAAAAADYQAKEDAALIYFFGQNTEGKAFVPTEYDPTLGVTLREFETIKNSAGILTKQSVADALGTEKANPEAIYDTAVRNLAAYLKEHPDVAPGKNPLQIMRDVFDYHRGALGHWVEKVTVEGEGTLDVSRQVDGRWVYPYSAYSKEMNAWLDIMCNGEPKESTDGLNLMNPIEHLDEVHDANNNNQVMFDCGVAVLKRGKKVVKNVLEQQEFVASTETVNKNVEVGVAVSTGTVNNDIEVTQPQKQVVYLRKTTNITNGKFEYTPGHSKMGDVMKITAANKKTPTI